MIQLLKNKEVVATGKTPTGIARAYNKELDYNTLMLLNRVAYFVDKQDNRWEYSGEPEYSPARHHYIFNYIATKGVQILKFNSLKALSELLGINVTNLNNIITEHKKTGDDILNIDNWQIKVKKNEKI